MAVKVRPFVVEVEHVPGCRRCRCGPGCVRKTDGWEVDVQVTLPSREVIRERKKSPVTSKTGSREWGERRAAVLARDGAKAHRKEVPTLREFGPRYLEEYARANREKPSTIIQKEGILRFHLYPRLGAKALDQIGDADVQKLKAALADRSPKTVNNVLVVLNTLLKAAVKWKVMDRIPCTIELLRVTSGTVAFYEPSEFERLVKAARQVDSRIEVFVLLGGEAGLRCGEIIALEQADLDFTRGLIHVRRSEWEGHVTVPKGGRERTVNMTPRLKAALLANRHLRGERVLWRDDGREKVTQVLLAKWMRRAQKRAGLKVTGGIHVLRHTFCSRLAMIGSVPARSIQELAGHQSLSTTMRYMHLSPSAKPLAIEALARATEAEIDGDKMETAQASARNP